MSWAERLQACAEATVFTAVIVFHILLFGSMLLQACRGDELPVEAPPVEDAVLAGSVLFPTTVPLEAEGERDAPTLLEVLATPSWTWPDAVAERAHDAARLHRAMAASLSPAGLAVLLLRYGLFDGDPWTLRGISERLGVSKERVRQLEREALAALRRELRGTGRRAGRARWSRSEEWASRLLAMMRRSARRGSLEIP